MHHRFLLSCMVVTLFPKTLHEIHDKSPITVIKAVVGDDVLLPCHLESKTNAVAKTIEWSRGDLKPKYVHIHRNGLELMDSNKNPFYMNRTALFIENMKTGNISLKLSRVMLSDTGNYNCSSPSENLINQVQLLVYNVSEPVIVNLGTKDGGVVLQCKVRSYGSKPVVKWMKKDGPEILNASIDIVPDLEGYYNVTSNVTVHQTASNTFICSVESKEKEITFPVADFTGQADDKPDDGSNQTGNQRLGLVVVLVVVLVVGVGCYIHRQYHGGNTQNGQEMEMMNRPAAQNEPQDGDQVGAPAETDDLQPSTPHEHSD